MSQPTDIPTQPSAPESAPSNTLSILALVFAILAPVVGLVLAIVARAQAKRDQRQPDTLTTVALVISIVLTALGVVAVVGSLVFLVAVGNTAASAISQPATVIEEPQDAQASVRATSADGEVTSGDVNDAVKAVLLHRIDRAGLEFNSFQQDEDGDWVMTFDEAATEVEMSAAAETLAAPLDGGFWSVAYVGDTAVVKDATVSDGVDPDLEAALVAFAETDCADTPVDAGAGYVVACDPAMTAKYLLGEEFVPLDAVDSVEPGIDSVLLVLDADGTRAFGELSQEAYATAPPGNQVALLVNGEVVTAPTMNGVILDGRVNVTTPTPDDLDLMTAIAKLAVADVVLQVGTVQSAR